MLFAILFILSFVAITVIVISIVIILSKRTPAQAPAQAPMAMTTDSLPYVDPIPYSPQPPTLVSDDYTFGSPISGPSDSQTPSDDGVLSIDNNKDLFLDGVKVPNTSGVIQIFRTLDKKYFVAVNIDNFVFIRESLTSGNWLLVPNTSGVKSLSQLTNGTFKAITVNNDTYTSPSISNPQWVLDNN